MKYVKYNLLYRVQDEAVPAGMRAGDVGQLRKDSDQVDERGRSWSQISSDSPPSFAHGWFRFHNR